MSSRARVLQPRNDQTQQVGTREYSKFGLEHNVYHLPIDEDEELRQDGMNRILRDRLGSSVLVPFPPDNVEEPAVLDCGFGKASWIDDFLSDYDQCVVTGIDIFLGEEVNEDGDEDDPPVDHGVEEFIKKRWNLNAPFASDTSDTRLRPESFDLINCRFMAEAIDRQRWPVLISEFRRLLKPGGWIQMIESNLCFQSDNGMLPDVSATNAWWSWYSRYMDIAGRDARCGRHLERYCQAAGFERVTATQYRLPVGGWDPARRALGRLVREDVFRLLKTFALPFVQVAGMTVEVCRTVVSRASAELGEDAIKPYYMIHVATARRPRRR